MSVQEEIDERSTREAPVWPEASVLPRLLILCEFTMATSHGGAMSNPTMYNLFAGYPPEKMLWLAPTKSVREWPPQPPFDEGWLDYRDPLLPRPRRGARFTTPMLDRVEYQLRDILPLPRWREIEAFAPQALVVTPFLPGGLLLGERYGRALKIPSVAYFMDDWPALNSRRWLTGSVRDRARAILAQSDAWIMISDELSDSMIRRYGVSPKPTLVAHNPVDVDGHDDPVFMPRRSGRFRVVYAGTVQTMHADAILAVAEAIHRLRESGIDIEMVLHTPQWCERIYEEQWRRFGVVMGGLVPYSDLNRVLRDADLLLVGLSFDPIVAHMAMYSLLTKITDYMATGVPILICGPAGSASVNFAKRWDVALTCETKDVTRLADLIRDQVSRPETNAALARRAWRCLQAQFSTAVVRSRLYSFLTRVARKQQLADCVS